MTRYIITSVSFAGEVYALYGEEGLLQHIDFGAAALEPEQVAWLKDRIPASGNPAETIKHGRLTVTNEAFAVTFEMFWKRYAKPINRKRCEPKFTRLNKADQARAYAGIVVYDRFLAKNNWRTKADPDTYLTDKYWENEWKA